MDWNTTRLTKERLGLDGDFYKGRHLIRQDSSIDGGICLGTHPREAIVVDSQYSPTLIHTYEIAKKKSTRQGKIDKSRILKSVYEAVSEAMPIQKNSEVIRLIDSHNAHNDGVMSLEVFLREGVGVCRHDALACAFILERLGREGIVKGKPSVDKNYDEPSGHAWCRYTNSQGKVFILDVMQGYLGPLGSPTPGKWDYRRNIRDLARQPKA
jgi:hypothetical protein